MATLEQDFNKALLATYQRSKNEVGYTSYLFMEMLNRYGGVGTAAHLINQPQPSQGYTTLFEKGRLDLTVEAVVVNEPRWYPLFSEETIDKARKRLRAFGYRFGDNPPTSDGETGLGAEQRRAPWSQAQVDTCVAAYFEMLQFELESQPYSKAEFNRQVQEATGHSKGSVEFKFQNVSAVLDEIGLKWIEGYKPAKNAQRGAILEAVEKMLGANAVLAARLDAKPTTARPMPLNPEEVFTDAPPRSQPASSPVQLPPGSKVKKFDRALMDARNRDLGRAGEEFVLHVEKQWLETHGRSDLARQVAWVSEEQGDGAGYDIASFDLDGTPRLIEVKTTNADATSSFLVTANEVEVSRANPDRFWLYRVYELAKEPRIYRERGPLDAGWTLSPAVYRAKR